MPIRTLILPQNLAIRKFYEAGRQAGCISTFWPTHLLRRDRQIPPHSIEAKWQKRWADEGLYRTPEKDVTNQPTFYCLDFFPYPSGAGLSVGHCRNYVPTDVISRYHRMKGYAVLHPMGWDAFGLPAENEAINKSGRNGFCSGFGGWGIGGIEEMASQEREEPGDQGTGNRAINEKTLSRARHRTVWRVTRDIEAFKFNTAVAAMMEYSNTLASALAQDGHTLTCVGAIETLIRLLAPFAPHIAEELWARRGNDFSVHQQPWPTYDPALTSEKTTTLIVQVNKVRDRLVVPSDIDDDTAQKRALASERVQRYLNGNQPKKVIIVPGRLVNFHIKDWSSFLKLDQSQSVQKERRAGTGQVPCSSFLTRRRKEYL